MNASIRKTLAIIIGIVIGCASFSFLAIRNRDFKPEQAGFGLNTYGVTDTWDRYPISDGVFSGIRSGWDYFKRQKKQKIVLWLGASQTYTINNPKKEQHLAVWHLNSHFQTQAHSATALLLARPNGNLHDLLALYLTARNNGYVPDLLVVGVVFDDLRDPAGQSEVLRELPTLSEELLGYRGIRQLRDIQRDFLNQRMPLSSAAVAKEQTHQSPQQKLEERIIELLERYYPGYSSREKLGAKLQVSIAGLGAGLRQKILHRRAPRIPQDRIDWSYAALESLVRLAHGDGVKILLYKAPHRPGEPVFYHDREDYDDFFRRVEDFSKKTGAMFADYETSVPENYWGLTDGRLPDVFHFREEGHKILARMIYNTILAEEKLKSVIQ